jgi:predicted NAD/FAD-binding protein
VLLQVKRFHGRAQNYLHKTPDSDLTTFAEFLARENFSQDFCRWYAMPLVACVWSSGTATARDYPARYLFEFLDHHGMLQVKGSPQWYTVTGGSRAYVDAIATRLTDARVGVGASEVRRSPDGVTVTATDGTATEYDAVVIAAHADDALGLLADPTDAERSVLGAFRYSRNETILHQDFSIMPDAKGAHASWNYRIPSASTDDEPPLVTYWMNKLQRLDTDDSSLVSLGAGNRIAPQHVLAVMEYLHPVYEPASVAAQRRLPELSTGRTVFAGAYHGWGFHEDGCRSGVAAARALGIDW